jgi:hypothetical protein
MPIIYLEVAYGEKELDLKTTRMAASFSGTREYPLAPEKDKPD